MVWALSLAANNARHVVSKELKPGHLSVFKLNDLNTGGHQQTLHFPWLLNPTMIFLAWGPVSINKLSSAVISYLYPDYLKLWMQVLSRIFPSVDLLCEKSCLFLINTEVWSAITCKLTLNQGGRSVRAFYQMKCQHHTERKITNISFSLKLVMS